VIVKKHNLFHALTSMSTFLLFFIEFRFYESNYLLILKGLPNAQAHNQVPPKILICIYSFSLANAQAHNQVPFRL